MQGGSALGIREIDHIFKHYHEIREMLERLYHLIIIIVMDKNIRRAKIELT